LLTPTVLLTQSIDWAPMRRFAIGGVLRYSNRSYLDNTNDARFVTPAWTTVDGSASYEVTRAIRVTVRVNNIFDARRVYPSGYSYQFITQPSSAIDGISYYYPQATRNAVVLVDFKL